MSSAQLLNQAIELSRDILVAIENSDLETVSKIDENRQSKINGYFLGQSDIDVKQTQLLKQLNDEIVAKLTKMQSQTCSRQIDLNHSSKATKAYLDNAG